MDKQQLLFFILLALSLVILYSLPFIPAFIEWKNKVDAGPFLVNFQDRTIVDYSIRVFKEYIDTHFGPILEEYNHLDAYHEGKHVNGCEYYITGTKGLITLSDREVSYKKTNKTILLCHQGVLPEEMAFNNKIYAQKSLVTGRNNTLNEVIAKGDIQLKSNGVVNKLLYSEASITIGDRCVLNGYTRALNKIHFLGTAQYKYLYASRIEFGAVCTQQPGSSIDVLLENIPRRISQDKLIIQNNTQHISHMVSKKSLIIGSDCQIKGNIKSYGDVCIGSNTSIIGALFSEKDIRISKGCFIQGPIIAKGAIVIDQNCIIGTRDGLTSLIGQTVIMSSGCCVSGLLLAKLNGGLK